MRSRAPGVVTRHARARDARSAIREQVQIRFFVVCGGHRLRAINGY